ncbi:MAG TPA: hypothetical protein VGR13_08225 [Actinomycetota bacterium]|nr:hypothetical protein [Actinomycetota bacterium]
MLTPEEAARGSIPERYGRELAVSLSPDGEQAAVLLETNERPYIYPYLVFCDRTAEGWTEGSSGSAEGLTWHRTTPIDSPSAAGVVILVGEAPNEAQRAVVAWRSEEKTVPVREGYFLYAEWDVLDSETRDWPRLVRFMYQS